MPALNTHLALDPERLASAIERLPADQRAALRWAPVAFEKPIRQLLEIESLDESTCHDAAATFLEHLPRVLLAIASVDQDGLLAGIFASNAAGRTPHLDKALPLLQRTDIVAEHLCLWIRSVLNDSSPFDQELLSFLLRPQFLNPSSGQLSTTPDLAAELCLVALALGVRERLSPARLHTLSVLAFHLLAEWIAGQDALIEAFDEWVKGPDLLDEADREYVAKGLRVLKARQQVLQRHIAPFRILESVIDLVDAHQWKKIIHLLEAHDLEAPESSTLASLHQRVTSGRALPVVVPGRSQTLASSAQVRAALDRAPSRDRWIAVNPEGQCESARTLPDLQERIVGQEKDMLFIGRGERPDAV